MLALFEKVLYIYEVITFDLRKWNIYEEDYNYERESCTCLFRRTGHYRYYSMAEGNSFDYDVISSLHRLRTGQ